MKYITHVDGQEFEVEILGRHRVKINGQELAVDFQSVSGQPLYSLIVDGRSFEAYIYPAEGDWQVLLHGDLYDVKVEDERERRLRAASGKQAADVGAFQLKAPMPGLVVTVPVQPGDSVEKGDVLVILESMKMQNELRSPKAGTVAAVKVQPGDSVEQRETLVVVE